MSGDGRFPGFVADPDAGAPSARRLRPRHRRARSGGRAPPALTAAFAVAEEHGVEAHGIWTVAEQEQGWALGDAERGAERRTDAFMKVICIAPDGRSGYACASSVAARRPRRPGARRAAAAARRCMRRRAGRAAARRVPGRVRGAGRRLAVRPARRVRLQRARPRRGPRRARRELGETVAAPAINLADSPGHPRTLPRSFDAEGTRKAPLPLIQDGVAHGVAHDIRSAALAGARTTGHALAPGGDPRRPPPHQPGARRRRRGRRGRAVRAGRARRLRDPALVRERGAPEGDADHRGHPRRHVPDRGRQGHPPAPRPAPDRQRAAHPLGHHGALPATRRSRATASSTAAASPTAWSARRCRADAVRFTGAAG